MDKKILKLAAQAELARRNFFFYCNLMAPDFYREDREYLVELCNEFQAFLACPEEKVMVVNEPPRHGKSRTAGKLVEWILGRDQTKKVMTGSYNEILSTTFSKNVRNTIQEGKGDLYVPVFSDVFPGAKIKSGDAAMNLWSLEGGYNNYLATSPSGTATGFGADIIIIDDLIKNDEEAYNENTKERHWEWFTNTMLSRLEEGGKIIIIMTRWASDDLAGRALEHYREHGVKVRHVSMRAVLDGNEHRMLCPEILSYKSYQEKVSAMGEDIASANYNQEPIDLKGQLYTSFKTYTELPGDGKLFTAIKNYTDTADEGDDYLCSITYGVYNKEAYVLDVVYTQRPMEDTESMVAESLYANGANISKVESNNGGRGFARSVGRILSERFGSNKTKVKWFHQSQNKIARILSNATWVMGHIYFPVNWRDRWPDYYKAMVKYQREGKNKHDDAPDATTGVAENTLRAGGVKIMQ